MRIVHLIPADETELHDINAECLCNPVQVPLSNVEGVEPLQDVDIVYEHEPFSPDFVKVGSNYSINEEV